jgi:hypothetical protein
MTGVVVCPPFSRLTLSYTQFLTVIVVKSCVSYEVTTNERLSVQATRQGLIWVAAKTGYKELLQHCLVGATVDDLKFEKKTEVLNPSNAKSSVCFLHGTKTVPQFRSCLYRAGRF